MMKMKYEIKFSVIIPIYNKGSVLDKAINSVLSQTYYNYEILLINDGSTDNTNEVVLRYLDNEKIRYIEQTNQGVSVARNTGISSSTGSLITFLDPDDEWYKNHLETLYQCYIENDKIEALYSTAYDVRLFDGEIISVQNEVYAKIINSNNLWKVIEDPFSILYQYNHPPIHTNSIMIPRTIFNNVNMFLPGCKRSQDTDLWCRIALKFPFILINATTTLYHREESTATRKVKMNYEWPFLKTADDFILRNPSYPYTNNLIRTVDVTRIAMARHLIMEDKKREAVKKLKQIHRVDFVWVKFLITLTCLILPVKFVKTLYSIKNPSYMEK